LYHSIRKNDGSIIAITLYNLKNNITETIMKLITNLFFLFLVLNITALSQTINVGKGSYGTNLPSGEVGPQTASGAIAIPKISSDFNKPVQTCDFWSSLIYPFYGNPHSNVIYAHPLNFKAVNNGLQVGYTSTHVFAAQDYLFPFSQQFTVGVTGLNASKTQTDDYGDWTVTALWDDGSQKMKATFGHGLPFAFFTISGGNASITTIATPNIWHNKDGVIGLTIDGKNYGIFASDSSTWSGTTTLISSLNGKDYFSIALLPDNQLNTLEIYRQHAYAFVTNSKVDWNYDEQNAKLTSTFVYTTELKENKNGNVNQTLTALYIHQWINTNATFTNYEYSSVAGKMKIFDGNQFSTYLNFEGVLPALPDEGDYNKAELLEMVKLIANESLSATGDFAGTYWNGKMIARFAHLVNIADQLGAITERDYFLSQIKNRLEDWFTVGGAQSYVYNSTWKTLTGYPSEFGADNQINDHNFHSGYAIMGAAIVAQFDSVWASQDNWGGMVNLLIKDGNNYDRSDEKFPFLRALDAYAGHSWESGHGDFGDGNNEESSSESMNFATAVTLWGEITHQKNIRDLGIFLYTTERSAIEQYWFDIDNSVFPSTYPYKALGMVWGGKGVHSTWFGANPDFIHGINMLPFNGGSLYLGRNANYVQSNYNEVESELNGTSATWKDILWQYLALVNPASALSMFFANPNYTPEDGETKAHTYHWLGNMKKMGQLDISVTANVPTYTVLKNNSNEKTYIAYNSSSDTVTVNFSDGYSMIVSPRLMKSENTSSANINAPVVILVTDKISGKLPLTIKFLGSRSFDENNSSLTYNWNFGDGTTSDSSNVVHQFLELGEFNVMLTVTNQQSLSTKDSIKITVIGNGTPYFGTPILIPALLQAENFDKGGEGIAYHDVDANNIGIAYRSNEGVDLEASNDQGFDIYWMVASEWIEFTMQVPTDGLYDIIPYVASVPGFGNFRILINNVDVRGKIQVLNTGGWQSWYAIPVVDVSLKAGAQILRVEIDTDYQSEKKNWLFSLNSIKIQSASSTGVESNNSIATKYELLQNYPNPFNPSTTIRYSIPSLKSPLLRGVGGVLVSLKIYDILGSVVATLVNENKSAGNYEAKFDGSKLVSGVYFYKISSGVFSNVKKMILVK